MAKTTPMGKWWRWLRYLLRNFNIKHRISVRNRHGDTEVWYMYISPLRITLAIIGVLIVMFAIVLLTAVYTPIFDTVPGYPGKKSREALTMNILRLDSLENELGYIRKYSENVATIMDGRIPEAEVAVLPDGTAETRMLIPPSAQDSLLRGQIETDDRYALSTQSFTSAPGRTLPVAFIAPVQGQITTPFSPVNNMYGLGYTLIESQQVVAAREGTVIMAMWTPSDDYIIQIQHKGDFVTIYKRNSQLLKSIGDRVEAGEAIGYVSVTDTHAAGFGENGFVFELWSDGRPVDPSYYISSY